MDANNTVAKNKISKNLENASICRISISPLVIVVVLRLPSMISISIIPIVVNKVTVAKSPGIAVEPVASVSNTQLTLPTNREV